MEPYWISFTYRFWSLFLINQDKDLMDILQISSCQNSQQLSHIPLFSCPGKIPWNLKPLPSLKGRSRPVSLCRSSFGYAMRKRVGNGSGESRTCFAQMLTMMLILYCCGDTRRGLSSLLLLEWYWRREENRSHVFRSTKPDLITHMCWILRNTEHTDFPADQYCCPSSPAAHVQQWE